MTGRTVRPGGRPVNLRDPPRRRCPAPARLVRPVERAGVVGPPVPLPEILEMALLKRRPAAPAESTPGCSVLDAKLAVVGDLETEGTLRIDGTLRGCVRRADLVVIGPDATVEGDVVAREVVVGGAVLGNILAEERAEVQATAVVTGDITTGAILIHEGGAVRGRLLVRAHEERAIALRPTPRSVRLVAGGGGASAPADPGDAR